jgi:hypothetical protein
MAQGPTEPGLEQVFRAYGRLLRAVASAIPGERATQVLDDAAGALRGALGVEPAEPRIPPPPAEAMPSEHPEADLDAGAATIEFGAVEPDQEQAAAGPIAYSIPRPGESGRRGTIFASHQEEIAAPVEQCWDVAADVLTAVEWTPLLLEARIAPENDTDPPTVFDTVADAKVRKTKSKLRFEYDRPRGMRWEQLSGDQKFLIGAWEFEPLAGGGVRATYLVETDLGRVLSMAIRGPVRDRVTDMLTRGSVEGLKATVE